MCVRGPKSIDGVTPVKTTLDRRALLKQASATAAQKAKEVGLRTVDVRVSGPGSGRESAIRALATSGLEVRGIKDSTPIPHNGCRPPKKRRV